MLVRIIFFTFLLIGSIPAAAQRTPLGPEEINDYRIQLREAESGRASLQQRLGCLEKLETDLIDQRDKDQLVLAELRRDQGILKIKFEIIRGEYNQFMDNYAHKRHEMDVWRGELERLLQDKRYRDETLRQCKEAIWVPLINEVSCEASVRIVSIIDGALRQNEEGVERAQREYDRAWSDFRDAQNRLETAEQALKSLDDQFAPLLSRIGATETNIVQLARNLATLRLHAIETDDLLGAFQHELATSSSINTDDGRSRTSMMLQKITQALKSSLIKLQTLYQDGTRSLPEILKNRCPAK